MTRPNPRLQRTRSASPPSPLSRQPFGRLWVLACLIPLGAGQSIRAQEPQYAFKGHNILPKSVPISQEQILNMLVPNYQEKLKKSEAKLANQNDPHAYWHTYEAAIVSFRRTNLGIRGEDFLIVAIEEIDEPCLFCRFSVFGAVDLKRQTNMGSFRSKDSSVPGPRSLALVKSGRPWQLRFRYESGDGSGRYGVEWERAGSLARDASDAWHFEFGEVLERFAGGSH